mmetsp:Transcript_78444/g.224792  ORF Transcript_78444/g.224792 Transcript_78444/m.224792 type:complete len:207 (+) Transcript_78444:743-1363(+)
MKCPRCNRFASWASASPKKCAACKETLRRSKTAKGSWTACTPGRNEPIKKLTVSHEHTASSEPGRSSTPASKKPQGFSALADSSSKRYDSMPGNDWSPALARRANGVDALRVAGTASSAARISGPSTRSTALVLEAKAARPGWRETKTSAAPLMSSRRSVQESNLKMWILVAVLPASTMTLYVDGRVADTRSKIAESTEPPRNSPA